LFLQAKFYAGCELLALEHLALKSMAYRDLKPENTLVDTDGYCKMIDMGFAKIIKGKSKFCELDNIRNFNQLSERLAYLVRFP
jgi:serine/threonine protein kinase